MGAFCGIPAQAEHKINISVSIPELVKQIEKEVAKKVEPQVEEAKDIASYIQTSELYRI